jgi:hypothetical protein
MDDMPNFDSPPAATEPKPPKKPKPKPTRQVRKAVAAMPKRRRKRRVVRTKPVETHAGGKFTPEIYRLIGALLNLETPMLNFVMEVTKGLSK